MSDDRQGSHIELVGRASAGPVGYTFQILALGLLLTVSAISCPKHHKSVLFLRLVRMLVLNLLGG